MNTQINISRNTARWVSLGVGGLGLIVGIITLIVGPLNSGDTATTFRTVSYVGFALAILGLVGFVMADPQSIVESITGRSGQYTITTWLMAVLFTAFVIALFVIIRSAAIKPLDLTAAQKYAMSDTTRKLLQDLKQNVQVTGFYTSQQSTDQSDADLWLKQYKNISNGKVDYTFVDPDKNPGMATQLGMSRSDTMVFRSGTQKSEASAATEQDMTNALLQVLSGDKRTAYVVTGDGERSMSDFQPTGLSQFESVLTNSNFTVIELNLLQKNAIPDDAKLVVLAGPTNPMLPAVVDTLNAYVDKGGSLIVMVDAGQLTSDDPLIKSLKDKWGITVRDDIAVDAVTQSYTDPLTPIIFNFDDTSPITKGMNSGQRRIVLSTARSLVPANPAPANITLTPLLMTSNVQGAVSSWGEVGFDPNQPNISFDKTKDNPGPLDLAVSGENSQTKGRIVVFGDSDWASNQWIQGDKYNGDLVLNTANWLTHKEDLISLPAPADVGQRSLDKLSQPVALLVGIGGLCIIPLIMVGAGVVVWVVRRRRR